MIPANVEAVILHRLKEDLRTTGLSERNKKILEAKNLRELIHVARDLCYDLEGFILHLLKAAWPNEDWDIDDLIGWANLECKDVHKAKAIERRKQKC